MARYIDMDKLLQDMCASHHLRIFSRNDADDMFEKMVEITQRQPTADVVEVKHGEWLKTEEPLGYRDVDCIECSACHDSWVIDEDFDFEDHKQYWKYCPNCGAKMDGRGGSK